MYNCESYNNNVSCPNNMPVTVYVVSWWGKWFSWPLKKNSNDICDQGGQNQSDELGKILLFLYYCQIIWHWLQYLSDSELLTYASIFYYF